MIRSIKEFEEDCTQDPQFRRGSNRCPMAASSRRFTPGAAEHFGDLAMAKSAVPGTQGQTESKTPSRGVRLVLPRWKTTGADEELIDSNRHAQ